MQENDIKHVFGAEPWIESLDLTIGEVTPDYKIRHPPFQLRSRVVLGAMTVVVVTGLVLII